MTNPDNIQKAVKKEADKIYPEIYFKTEVYENDSKRCVRVEIRHNGLAPHFGGAAWVRKGTETIRATDELYQQMVEFRQGKVRELFRWLKRDITVEGSQQRAFLADPYIASEWSVGVHNVTLEAVNPHWATFKLYTAPRVEKSEPMEKLLLSWDDDRKCLKVVVKNWTRTA